MTTSTTFQTKLNVTTASVPAGTYRIGVSYGYNHDAANSDFEGRFRLDSTTQGEIHKQESKDSGGTFGSTGTSQRYYHYQIYYVTLTAATHTLTIQYRTDDSAAESSIWQAQIEFWRVE